MALPPELVGDNVIRICIVVFGADCIQRLFFVGTEYKLQSKYYLPEDRLGTITRRAFSYHSNSIWPAIGLMLIGLIRLCSNGNLSQLLPSKEFLAFMPLYWVFTYAHLTHSSLSYAHWVREPHGLDYASGMASNYFHGYLKLALPEVNGDGLKKRMQKYEDSNEILFGIDRLLILIPDEMFVEGEIKSVLWLEKVNPLEIKYINRAGVGRPFIHAVYRIKKPINGKFYYVAMEGATPMLSFFEAMNFQLSTTWQMREMKREIWLKFTKHLKMLLKKWPETEHEVELIIYNSRTPNGQLTDVGERIYEHVKAFLDDKQNKKFD